ncbi:MAG: hypothetical protein JJU37_01435 [Balneolaceae bacterium]|nr:hypothetical protein [Balneolaceae bacterium]
MAREIRFLKSLLPLLLISVFTANISWAQVNPVASKVTAEEKLFVEYIATIFVEPNDSNGDLVEVDPDDLSVELDDSYSGRVTIGDFEPVVVRRQIVGYAAGMSTNEAQTISGTVELAGSRLPLGAFSTKFQEIGNISSVTTEVSSALADGEDEVLIRVILLDDDRMAIEGVHEEDFELAFKAAGPPQIQSFEEDSDAAGFYYIGITNTESGSGSYELRVAGRFVGSASFTFEEIDPVELVDQTRTIVEATSPHRPDGQDASTITVSLFDANNDPVDGVPENEIWLTYISGGSDFLSFSGFSETSDVGVFEGQLTNSQIATVEVAARINGEDSYDTARIVFQAEPVSASNSEVTATSPHAADGEDASVVTIKLFDESGNPRMITSGMSFNFDISGDASMAGKIRADESGSSQTGSIVGPADSNETELEIVNETEETVTVAVSVFDPNIEEWVLLDDVPEIEFITMPDPELSNITGTSGSAIADGSDEIIITVELLDSSNQPINTVASDEFEIVVGGNATKTSVEKIDGKDGLYEFRLRNNTVETVDVTVFARNISIDSIEVEFEKEPEPDDPVVDASSSSVEATSPHTADGNDASTVTVTVMGDDVNPMTGFSNSDFDIDLTGNASASNVSNEGGGEYEFEVTNSTAQTVTLTVTVDGT